MPSLKEVGGWTPVIDHLVAKYGRTVATCYGVIWRFTQMSDRNICDKADATLAHWAGISLSTLVRSKAILLKEGYISDVDADPEAKKKRQGLPVRYRCTDKIRLRIAFVDVEEDQGDDPLV